MILVKSTASSAVTPNCPATSITAAISFCELAVVCAISFIPLSRSAYEVLEVSSTVFITPVKADSQSTAACADLPNPATTGAVIASDIVRPKAVTCLLTAVILPPIAWNFAPTISREEGIVFKVACNLFNSVCACATASFHFRVFVSFSPYLAADFSIIAVNSATLFFCASIC